MKVKIAVILYHDDPEPMVLVFHDYTSNDTAMEIAKEKAIAKHNPEDPDDDLIITISTEEVL